MVGVLKSPFDQFNNVSVSWGRLNHLSIILILEIKTNQCVFSKRSSMVVNAINFNCQFEGVKCNTAISLELIDFQIRGEENLLCDYRKISKTY